MTISFIFAMDEARGFGLNNAMPWHLPADMAFFRKTTTGHTVLMGRKTFDSLQGRPLPKRHNIVLTRDKSYTAEGIQVVHSAEEVAQLYSRKGSKKDEELFVIGGVEVFKLLMPYADRMYVTRIAHRFEVDTSFPEIDLKEWTVVSDIPGVKDEKNHYDYRFLTYERVGR